ncbi:MULTISPECIES: bifunctional metallophosphatase/5'-nucleotidase [unclassified Polaribacter]|uniref:bifunctional metallophosphatase/5'-nucleotidase n=1 Tax=unclassified Polaribacter TaxID=196858 RepID=UPI0011BFAEB9|nr:MULTISPECIES: bifunctional metallophosphatase/5'-nucleotidase [unclassified Polaribacter]TXD51517.1 bifunctional metallophosphatase/5'-nucleotidase [Polaribacter sp. IC063]TXD58106.1 bifunctional metallophosphatase/5'-nucleotidase [Polaribacter sp. IC066]
MQLYKRLFFVIILGLLFSCKKDDQKIEFTFLQLNDVYEIAPIQGGEFGGMARVETVHQQLLKENKNTMLFMAGDFLNPSLLGTLKIDGERIRGEQMVDVMNAMNFDLVAFGNHEFDISQQDLQKRLNESNFPWISANVKLKTKEGVIPFYKEINGKKEKVLETFIKEFSDEDGTKIKVGFISVCIPSNPKNYVEYGNIFIEAKASYAALKDSVDVVFGLTHVKITNDKRIAKLIPDLPLIMGGHEHTNSYQTVGNVKIAKADANAKTAYIHRISFDKKTKKTLVKSELKEINATVKSDVKVGEIVSKWQQILLTQIKEVIPNPDEVIFTAKVPLDGRDMQVRSIQTNLGKIITRSMSFAFDDEVDCAIVNGGSIRIDDALEGNITPVDIFRVLPYGGAILKVKIKGRLLRRVLDYGELAAGTGAYLQRFNAEKIEKIWLIKNEKLDANKIYTVAFSDYLLKGFDIPFLSVENKEVLMLYTPTKNELAFDIRKTVVSFLKNKK